MKKKSQERYSNLSLDWQPYAYNDASLKKSLSRKIEVHPEK
jgi:hypothetical protein